MSDHVLPDDPRDWPQDPFELLGIAHTVDEKAIRRAYSQLIRRYKPEQSPAEFQKIRQAYDEARQRIQWQRFIHFVPEETDNGEVKSPATPSALDGQETSDATDSPVLPDLRPSADPLQAVRAAWSRAGEGDWSEAWRRLRELEHQLPDSQEVVHRLYWLRTLRPDLDGGDSTLSPGGTPRVPSTATLRAMFLTRMRASFRLACSAEADAWWTAPLPPWEKLAFLRARWGVAARQGEPGFARIEADLEPAGTMFQQDREIWFQTLVRAAELSYLGQGPAALALRARAEKLLGRERDLELQFSRMLESLDLLRELARHRKDSPTSREEGLMWLALRGLVSEEQDCRGELLVEIVSWAQSPAEGLALLDRVAARHPAFASLLRGQVEGYASEREMESDPPDPEWLARVVADETELLAALSRFSRSRAIDSDDGAEVRQRLLVLSLREGVRLGHLIEALSGTANGKIHESESLYAALQADDPLAVVTSGCLALWHV